MSRFKDADLFGSGPHRITVAGLTHRRLQHHPPDGRGSRVTTAGHEPRKIHQAGTLLADDLASLQAQLDAIEAAMDGTPGVLIDTLGRAHEQTLMLGFEPGPVRRAGARLALDYTIAYLRSRP